MKVERLHLSFLLLISMHGATAALFTLCFSSWICFVWLQILMSLS